jgi:hypothetical protein
VTGDVADDPPGLASLEIDEVEVVPPMIWAAGRCR